MASETAPSAQPSESAAPAAELATLTYRSRTVAPMSELELHRLLKTSQLRNRAEGVTGLMVYDCGWVFQQLEGPAPGLARIWASIRRDPRHTGIEVLSDAPSGERHFADWDLKLSIHGAGAGLAPRGLAEDPPELIGRLYRGEQPAELLVSPWLCDVPEPEPGAALAAATQELLSSRSALSNLIATVIIPRLHAAMPARIAVLPVPASQADALARLLIAPDADAAFAFIKAAHDLDGALGPLAIGMLEPAARSLGDLWQADDCSEFDVTLGLVRLQAITRELGGDAVRASVLRSPVVLVVPQPGEDHMLGASLDAEMLWRAGWNPQVDFPASSDALDALLANTWVDALDLSMSTSFRREHRLEQLGKTIAHARLASLNPHLVVVVSGRAFGLADEPGQPGDTGRGVGADASFESASQAVATILEALHLPPAPDQNG